MLTGYVGILLGLLSACVGAEIKGSNLGGYLLIEEWMFSNVSLFNFSFFIL